MLCGLVLLKEKMGTFQVVLEIFLKLTIAADGPYIGGPHANALGNHLGIWDIYYLKKSGDKKLKFYYQHFFEDTSSLRFANSIDGLWGFELIDYIKNTDILFEYLDTTNANNNPPYQDDYYYSNHQYLGGWTYKNFIIGNPFVNDTGLLKDFNKIRLLSVGINSTHSSYQYKLKASKVINNSSELFYKFSIQKDLSDSQGLGLFVANSKNGVGLGLFFEYMFL